MSVSGNNFSRDPNLCASCSSIVDGMEVSDMPLVCPVEAASEEGVPAPHDYAASNHEPIEAASARETDRV